MQVGIHITSIGPGRVVIAEIFIQLLVVEKQLKFLNLQPNFSILDINVDTLFDVLLQNASSLNLFLLFSGVSAQNPIHASLFLGEKRSAHDSFSSWSVAHGILDKSTLTPFLHYSICHVNSFCDDQGLVPCRHNSKST